MSTFRFSALDTWFFRESRPMETIGGSELASVFPPPPRTLLGAIRTAIGDNSGVDWKTFNKSHLLGNLIGFGDDLGPLKLSGPWLSWKGERLYPVPMFLLRKGDDFARMRIGDAAESSLGRVRLPEISQGRQGFKPMERTWINKIGLERLLAGQCVDKDHLFPAKRMFEEEARLGIARDNTTRIADDGLLYQTRHIRPKSDLAIEADIVLAQDSPTLRDWSGSVAKGAWRKSARSTVRDLSKSRSPWIKPGASFCCCSHRHALAKANAAGCHLASNLLMSMANGSGKAKSAIFKRRCTRPFSARHSVRADGTWPTTALAQFRA
jgi:CRISPR type III-B/RAMP module-associated protein Cmr3